MKNMTLAAVRRKNQWRGALIVDNEFKDALIDDSLTILVMDGLAGVLASGQQFPEGTEFSLNVVVRTPQAETAEGV